jgi:hypothetical protein
MPIAVTDPTHHVLDWFYLAMRVQHVAQAATSCPRRIATLVLASPRRSSGSDGVSGMVRSDGLWISLPKPSLQWTLQPTISCRLLSQRARWRAFWAISRHVFGQSDIIIGYATARRRD